MASAGDRSHDRDQSSVKDERGNPFVTFSRVVDQQLSSIFQTLSGLPLDFAERRRKYLEDKEFQKWEKDKLDAWEKIINDESKEGWRRKTQGLGEPQRSKEDEEFEKWIDDGAAAARQQLTSSLKEQCKRETQNIENSRVQQNLPGNSTQQEIQCSAEEIAACRNWARCVLDATAQYAAEDHDGGDDKDVQDAPPRCPYRPADDDDDDDEPELARDPRVRVRPAWSSWAFLQPQHPEDDLPENSSPSTSLQKRGIIDRSPFLSVRDFFEGPATRQPENDADEEAATELDLYQRFLETQNRTGSASHTSTQTFTSNTGAQSDSSKPSIISTMTTTQRCTLPDGSVYTKVVLKKGFSDGRGESTEKVHTTHGVPSILQQPSHKSVEVPKAQLMGYDGRVKQALEQKFNEQKKGGWFWS
ncbi:MAG: hypothetical protein Q9218_001707 [Villophora microphyllina]